MKDTDKNDSDSIKPKFQGGSPLALEDARTAYFKNLDILTAGIKPPDPVFLLSSERIKSILVDLKNESYDLIIFDAPPSLGLADAKLISAYSDLVLYVVNMGDTNKNQFKKTINKFIAKSNYALAAISNRSKVPGFSYGYYGNNYYYSENLYKYYEKNENRNYEETKSENDMNLKSKFKKFLKDNDQKSIKKSQAKSYLTQNRPKIYISNTLSSTFSKGESLSNNIDSKRSGSNYINTIIFNYHPTA